MILNKKIYLENFAPTVSYSYFLKVILYQKSKRDLYTQKFER